MKQTYQHVFANGDKITLVVEFADEGLIMIATPIDLTQHVKEYKTWLNQIVLPDIESRLTPAQFAAAVEHGLKTFSGKSKKK